MRISPALFIYYYSSDYLVQLPSVSYQGGISLVVSVSISAIEYVERNLDSVWTVHVRRVRTEGLCSEG